MELTIFTPTYNRRELLERLYNSLMQQTDTDFEWLVVDDGSTDDTEEFMKSLPETPFKLKYIKSKNAGKHIAINTGANNATGEWFFVVDNDDYLTSDAVVKLKGWIEEVKDLKGFAGFCTNKNYADGTQSGRKVEYDRLDTDFVSYWNVYHYNGDHPSCLRTEIWRQYQFPEYEGENFCTEALVLRRMSDNYICRYINDSVYITDGYLEGGLTRTLREKLKKSPSYATLVNKEQIHYVNTLKARLVTMYNYWRYYKLVPNPGPELAPTTQMRYLWYPVYLSIRTVLKLMGKC